MSIRGIGPHIAQSAMAAAKVDRPASGSRTVSTPFPHGLPEAEKTVSDLLKSIQQQITTQAQKGLERAQQAISDVENPNNIATQNKPQPVPQKSVANTDAEKQKMANEARHETHKPESSRSLAVLARVVEMLKTILNEIARTHSSVLEVLAQKINPPAESSSTDTDTSSDSQEEGEEDSTDSEGGTAKRSTSRPPVLNSTGQGSKRSFWLQPIQA